MDFSKILVIDETRLDQEWIDHPSHVREAGELEAEARYLHSKAKAALELTEADLYLAIRNAPHNFDLPDKPTQDAIRAAVVCHKHYQLDLKRLNRAKHVLDQASVGVSGLDHKKHALQNLVVLQGRDYYSEPRMPQMPQQAANNTRERITESKRRSTEGAIQRPKKRKPS